MPSVKVKENEPFDVALRRFKRSCEKAGVLSEVRRREHYEKPTAERKRKQAAAVKRHAKKLQREAKKLEKAIKGRPVPALVERIKDAVEDAMRARDKARLASCV